METRLEQFGFSRERQIAAGSCADGACFARVVSAHGDYYHLVADVAEGEILARCKASVFRLDGAVRPTTGDFVRFVHNPTGESRILAVVPRFSHFERVDPSSSGYRTQTIAVNFDTLLFLMSVNENFSMARFERVRRLAADSDALARLVVVLTKTDLVPRETCDALAAQFAAGGVPVCAISVKTGAGMAALAAYAKPAHTLALIGSSGVGKSSLVNALAGEEWMAVGEIQSWSGKGRHTTTSRELVRLPSGVLAIDTPGMRELGVVGRDGGNRFHSSGTHRYRGAMG